MFMTLQYFFALGNVHKSRPMIFDDFRPTYLPCLTIFNLHVRFWGVILDPLPTLKSDVIDGRSLYVIMMKFKTNCSR